MDKPVIPKIDDNIRLATKAYREKIYDDIDKRYSPIPFKNKVNELRSLSSPKAEKEKPRSISKKRPHSAKKETIEPLMKKNQNTSGVFRKVPTKYTTSPYFKSISKNNSL